MLIPNYVEIAARLHALTGKGDFKMTDTGLKSFYGIKQAIKDSVQVTIPLDDQPWQIEMDGSEVATSRILYQQQENRSWKMVDCISMKLWDAQLNYNIYDLEMLVIIQASRYTGITRTSLISRNQTHLMDDKTDGDSSSPCSTSRLSQEQESPMLLPMRFPNDWTIAKPSPGP